jgi:hypothetical protein
MATEAISSGSSSGAARLLLVLLIGGFVDGTGAISSGVISSSGDDPREATGALAGLRGMAGG